MNEQLMIEREKRGLGPYVDRRVPRVLGPLCEGGCGGRLPVGARGGQLRCGPCTYTKFLEVTAARGKAR